MYVDPVALRMLSEERVDTLIKEAEMYRRAAAAEENAEAVAVLQEDFLSRFLAWAKPSRILPRGI
jgi:hypothetical protein